jgi:hypothetical protein
MFRTIFTTTAVLLALVVVTAVRSDDSDDLRALIDKGIKAAGGQDKLGKFKAGTCKFKGKSLENNRNDTFSFDAFLQGADQVKIEGSVDHGGMQANVAFIINGDQGWVNFGGKVEEAPKEVLVVIKDLIRAFRSVHALAPLKEKGVTLSPLGEVEVSGKTAVGLKASVKDREDIHVFLDKATGLPLKTEFKMRKGDGQEHTLEFTVSDYKESEGRKHFTKVAASQDGKAIFEAEFSDIRWVDKLDASNFAKP